MAKKSSTTKLNRKNKKDPEVIETIVENVESTDLVPAELKEQVIAELEEQKDVLALHREKKALEARMKDLVYIDRIDQITAKFVDKLLEEDKLEKFLDRMLEEGKGKDLQAIMISLGITLDKREKLLSFDEERLKRNDGGKRTQFRVVFKGSDGSQAGVSVETSE
jgi:translation initiation factor RLI1